MTYSINWPITVRSAVPFRSVPEIITARLDYFDLSQLIFYVLRFNIVLALKLGPYLRGYMQVPLPLCVVFETPTC